MNLQTVVDVLEGIVPTRYAEAWDNVGLLAGDPQQAVRRALLTIDYTDAVAAEAARKECDLVVAYHPVIFHPLKRLTAGNLVFEAIRQGVAIYSPHTALDVAEGGTNDMLADALWLTDRAPLRIAEAKDKQVKLVVFVPKEALDRVSQAMFDAGAGRIGNYSQCSFRQTGTGTFRGEEGSEPTVGEAGRYEEVDEFRVETVVSVGSIDAAIRAVRTAHPYEEPAFDLVQLASPPLAVGLGRVGRFESPVERSILFSRVKRELELQHLLIAGPVDGLVSRVAVCAGACGVLLDDALKAGAELYLTGEVRHHDAIKAAKAGMTVVCTLHSNSERAVLKRLQARIQEKLPELDVVQSDEDVDPFTVR